MHDDVTRHEGSMGVAVTLKSKMAASSASSEGNSRFGDYNYNYHNVRSSRESIVLRHYA